MIALGSINDSENSSYVIYAQAAAPISSNIFSPSMSPFAIEPEVLGDDATLISQIIGPIFNRPQNGVEMPLPEPGYNLPSTNTSPMQSYDDGSGGLPPGNYDPPLFDVPTPGAIALLGMAAGFMGRRRNTRTQG
jgi:MYXO-CTERM domain-containing protein